jgi:hypothetical protein
MTKINLDQLINTKLEGLNFEFKNDYWKQMEKELSSNCGAEVASAGTGIGTFLSSVLIVSFTSILTIILIFPWAYDFDNLDNNSNINNTTKEEIVIEEAIAPEIETVTNKTETLIPTDDQNSKIEIKEEQTSPKVQIKKVRKSTSKKSKTISKKSKISKSNSSKVSSDTPDNKKVEKKVATTVESYDTAKEQTESLDTIIKKEVIIPDSEFNDKLNSDKNVLDSKTLINKEPVVYENDSVYIPDGILSGDKQAEEKPNPQVDVEAGPKPVKTVKPRSKPVKHVFRKRRGLLYRLGLRK